MSNFARKGNVRKRRGRVGQGLSRKQRIAVRQIITKEMEEEVEKKCYDTAWNGQPASLTPYLNDISDMGQGTGYDNRIGNTITVQSIQYRFVATIGDATNFMRLVLFQWKSDAQIAPTWDAIMQFQTAGVPIGIKDCLSPYLVSNGVSTEFKIIKDIRFLLDTDNPQQIIEGYIDKNFIKNVHYSDSSSFFGTNHLFMMLVSDSGAVSHPTLDGFIRLRYTDA